MSSGRGKNKKIRTLCFFQTSKVEENKVHNPRLLCIRVMPGSMWWWIGFHNLTIKHLMRQPSWGMFSPRALREKFLTPPPHSLRASSWGLFNQHTFFSKAGGVKTSTDIWLNPMTPRGGEWGPSENTIYSKFYFGTQLNYWLTFKYVPYISFLYLFWNPTS